MNWLASFYPWIKAVHVLAVISWMAGLLYLPRLFVYHTTAAQGSEMSETFKLMERRLAHAIMTPAMIASLVCGLLLLVTPGIWASGGSWLVLKLAAVVLLLAVHFAMMSWRRAFAEDRNVHSQKFFRVMNEVPTLLMIVIVIMVIVRPF
jgi:putative membrane protein